MDSSQYGKDRRRSKRGLAIYGMGVLSSCLHKKKSQTQVYFVAKNMDKLLKVHFSSSPLSYSSLSLGQ